MRSRLPRAAVRAARRVRPRVGAAVRSLRSTVGAATGTADPTSAPGARTRVAQSPSTTAPPDPLERRIARGLPLPDAVVETARAMVGAGRANEAVSMGYALTGEEATLELGHLVLGTARRESSKPELAWRDLSRVGGLELRVVGADDWFVPAYRAAPEEAASALREVLDRGLHSRWNGRQLVRVARAAFAADDLDAVRALISEGSRRTDRAVTRHHRHELARLATWLPDGARRRPVRPLPADVRIGVLNYHQPDVSSRNVGDWIQTLASLGHLVRHTGPSYVGEDQELVELVESLAAGTRPERRLPGPSATVQLVEVQRDAMPYQDLPDGTWVPVFGWFMHPTFDQGFAFPPPASVRPIFISFHLNKPDLLDDDAVAYLRRYGPVGCRDWQTVVALRSVGVPAFFSGCLTTTVDTVVPPGDPAGRTRTGYVDHPRQDAADGEVIEQTITGLRRRSFADNLALARSWVTGYATRYHRVYTSRLHCNLPARSVGCEVVFRPKNRSDVRFGGLIDIDDEAFEAIRQGLLDTLAAVLGPILAGADEETVYARWKEVTAPRVEAAERYLDGMEWDLGAPPEVPVLHPDAGRALVVDLAAGEAEHLEGFLTALAGHVPAGTAVVVAGDETVRSPRSEAELSEASGLPVAFLGGERVRVAGVRGRADRGLRHQVLLAASLMTAPRASRVVLLPAAALVRTDLRELFELDLEGHPVAAPPDPRRTRRLGASLARGVSARQGDEAASALTFLAAASRTVAPRATPVDPVVLVADPAGLRAGGYEQLVPLMTRYRASFREALNVVLGDRRLVLPERWATQVHLQTPLDDAAVLTYRVGTRPWSDLVTAGAQEWRRATGLEA